MANFTQTSYPNFNPYIQQLPVEAMAQVGMRKQQLYDEGIQKIQSNIENIAGLDVIRDVDKQYLQSKLNDLGTKLKYVAAGDFSNYQLTNSVGGMVTGIAKDTNIQNAVYSTSKYRKGVSAMETAKQEGKSSPSNEWLFNTEATQWLDNKDVSTKFNGSYQPYTNYKKNALEVIKSLAKDETITDDAFTIDKSGNLIISDAIVRRKLSGISPDKIQQALLAGLTPSDFRQMEIDGRYNYSNVSPEDFTNRINSSYKSKVEFYSKQKGELEAAKLQTQSNVQKNKLDEQIISLDKTLNIIKNEYTEVSNRFANGDVESAKAQLETSNFINNFSKAFSYTETSQTYENSPLAQIQMQRETKEQDWKKFVANYEQNDIQFNATLSQRKKEFEETKGANKAKETGENPLYGGLPASTNEKDVPAYNLARIVGDIQAATKSVETSDREFMSRWGKDKKWLDEQKLAYDKRGPNIDPLVAQHFNQTEQQRRNIEAKTVMLGQINKQAEAEKGNLSSMIPKDVPLIPYGNYDYSAKDIVDFNNTFNKYTQFIGSGGTGGGGGKVVYKDEEAARDLSPKELSLYKIYKRDREGGPLSLAEKVIVNNSKEYNQHINIPYSQKIGEINNFTAEEVTSRLTGNQGKEYEIPTGKEELRSSFGTALSSIANFAEKEGGGLANSKIDIPTLRKLAVDPLLTGTITVVEGTSVAPAMYEINVVGKDGVTSRFRLTPEQKMSVFGNRFEASPEIQALRPYQEQIRAMGGYSTAYTEGPSTHINSYLSNIDFPSVSSYGVKANLVESNGQYSIRLSVFDPITNKWHEDIPYPRTGLMDARMVVVAMRNLNDSNVYEILNDKIPSDRDLKTLQQASKKPL